jgi:hypothetical protein
VTLTTLKKRQRPEKGLRHPKGVDTLRRATVKVISDLGRIAHAASPNIGTSGDKRRFYAKLALQEGGLS